MHRVKTKGPKDTDARLEAAYARGHLIRTKLQQAEGGSISAFEAAIRLGISRSTVLRWYRKRKLIGWRESKSGLRVPVWQFRRRRLLPGLSEVLYLASARWHTIDDYGIMLFLLSNRKSLKGHRLIDLLRNGKLEKAKKAALGS